MDELARAKLMIQLGPPNCAAVHSRQEAVVGSPPCSVHDAAKMLVELSKSQDIVAGDGTTSVVILAAELLKRANELIRLRVHPTNIISAFKIAAKEACRYIENNLAVAVESLGEEALRNCAKTSMSSKLINADPTFFSNLVVDYLNGE